LKVHVKRSGRLFCGISCVLIAMIFFASAITGCETQQQDKQQDSGLQIVASISIIADIAGQIAGQRGEVQYLVPIGEEPEEYEPIPSDIRAANESDVVFVNGYGLEVWLNRLMTNVSDVPVIPTAENGPTISLVGSESPDPHLWLNPEYVRDYYVERIVSTLIELDPDGESYYRERARDYSHKLTDLHEWIKHQTEQIPDEARVIITSENCFKYYAEAYDLDCMGIWEINAPEEGTPQQIARIVQKIEDMTVPAVFLESTVDPRYMESISDETGVPIGGVVYSDDIGEKNSGADSYIKMMQQNTDVFVGALTD